MNYKTMLMASAAVLFASQAMAEDLTGAFSVPGKGQILSETTLGLTRTKTSWKVAGLGTVGSVINDSVFATETLEYGLSDKLSVNAGIINEFDVEGNYNNSHNFAYNLGAKYNTRYDDVLFQVGVRYNTWNPKSFNGHHNNDVRWQKSLGTDIKLGLDLGNGVTPYLVYSFDSDIDVKHRGIDQSVSLGVHKYAGKWALDGAVRYEWESNADNGEGSGRAKKNSTETWFDVAGDYYLRDNVALGLYGNYLVDAHDKSYGADKEHTNFDYEVGLRVKVLF